MTAILLSKSKDDEHAPYATTAKSAFMATMVTRYEVYTMFLETTVSGIGCSVDSRCELSQTTATQTKRRKTKTRTTVTETSNGDSSNCSRTEHRGPSLLRQSLRFFLSTCLVSSTTSFVPHLWSVLLFLLLYYCCIAAVWPCNDHSQSPRLSTLPTSTQSTDHEKQYREHTTPTDGPSAAMPNLRYDVVAPHIAHASNEQQASNSAQQPPPTIADCGPSSAVANPRGCRLLPLKNTSKAQRATNKRTNEQTNEGTMNNEQRTTNNERTNKRTMRSNSSVSDCE